MSRLFMLGDHRALLAPLNDESYSDPAQEDTSWDDLQGDVATGTGGVALVFDAFRDTPFKVLCFRHNLDDELHMRFQMPHRWNRGEVRPHVHLIPLADPAAPANIRLAGQYAWLTTGALPANSGWTTFTVDLTINPGDVNKQKVARVGPVGTIIPPVGDAIESAIFVLYFKRAATDPADTYKTNKGSGTAAANLGVLSADIHFQSEKLGTADEIPFIG